MPDQSTKSITSRQTNLMETQLSNSLQALTLSKVALKELREQRLRHLLRYAKKHSPWYRRQLKHISVDTFREVQLPDLPILTKKILMNNWDEIVTDRRLSLEQVETHIKKIHHNPDQLLLLDEYRLIVTSGSSGLRGVFAYHLNEWVTYYLMFKRFRFYNHDRTRLVLNPLQKKVIAYIVGTNPLHSIYSLEKTFSTRHTESIYLPITLSFEEIVNGLNQVQPDVIVGSSMTLNRLTKAAHGRQLCISPKAISLFGEALYPLIKQAIKSTWPGTAIFNTFGASEGLSGSYCRADSDVMHINDDLCILEPVDKHNQAISLDTMSNRSLITNLFNLTLPIIRYELNDKITCLSRQCDCGISHQLIAEPNHRSDFDFYYHDTVFVSHVVFSFPLLKEKNIREFQVRQTRQGAVILIVKTSNIDLVGLQHLMTSQLKKLGVRNPIIEFKFVRNFDYPASGKLRRFIPLKEE